MTAQAKTETLGNAGILLGGSMTSLRTKFAALIMTAIALSGCAWTPHEVNLQPSVKVPPSSVGQGTKVSFHFSDERDDTTIGHRSVATVGAKINAENLPKLVEKQLDDGLKAKGYDVVTSDADANSIVTFRLRAFQFYIETGFWTGGQNASAVLAVDALRGGRTFTNVYRFGNEQRILVVPGGNDIDAQMNAALNSILQQALSDGNLDLFLTGRSGG